MTNSIKKLLVVYGLAAFAFALAGENQAVAAQKRDCLAEVKRRPVPEASYETCSRVGEGRLNCNAYGGDALSSLHTACEAIKDYCCDGYSQYEVFSRGCIAAGQSCLNAEKKRIGADRN